MSKHVKGTSKMKKEELREKLAALLEAEASPAAMDADD
jgi:hypothetical protein